MASDTRHPIGPARRLLDLLGHLADQPSTLPVDDLTHSLQTASRAERAGADDEVIVAALFHDTGKAVLQGGWRHGPVAAELLRPYLRPELVWLVAVHEDFTAAEFVSGRRRHARHLHHWPPHRYDLARRFVDEWDLPARDPAYDTLPLGHFVPVVEGVLSNPRRPPEPRRLRPASWRDANRPPGHS